ncbi:thioredoxin family protein [Bdellovibrionota bacterium]
MDIGDRIIDFGLKGVDGKEHNLEEYADKKAIVILFTCNHCPYAQAYEDRFVEIQKDYASKGVQVIAINSNEDVNYPEDSFENMIERSKKKKFNFPYLRDEDQSIARAYDAACTPEVYLFDKDRELKYHGKIDDNWKHPTDVRDFYLRDAIDTVLAGGEVTFPEQPAIGCSIKWAR